jgi:hypothetical protein
MATTSIDPLAPAVTDFSLWRSRIERWRRVGHLLGRAELASGRLRDECADAAHSELTLLSDHEALFAYPGPDRVAALELLLSRRQVEGAVGAARLIVRDLVLRGDAAARPDAGAARYFTVVLVDANARARREALQRRLDELHRLDDSVVYALLALTSVEEVICAVRYNPYVEACVIGEGAPLAAARPTHLLPDGDRRRLAEANRDAPLGWLRDWLRTSRPDVTLARLGPPEALHQLLTHVS